MRGALVLGLALGGCNAIFGLAPTSLGGDAGGAIDARADGGAIDAALDGDARCTPIGHDEDGDGIDDACDRCPYIASLTGDPDSDGDGVGDDCDPHPGAP